MLHLNLLAPTDRHRADRGDDDEREPQPEREPDGVGAPTPSARTADLDEFDVLLSANGMGKVACPRIRPPRGSRRIGSIPGLSCEKRNSDRMRNDELCSLGYRE
ncbi:hypothetical protein [Kutzneria buriramensis]|uniref:Uncharacterized protein n=1 Tax=Kutzneria buriramensis TaxID=1045776 RepID=A0A3E0H5Z4_9PSEU|nr:hypothetical protein [Kutzneria buriramensis]REH38040.1 hypothetical protein BCF44_11465 [Kutzneria buriramensis]